MNTVARSVIYILSVVCGDAIAIFFFPDLADPSRWIIDIFLIIVLELLIFTNNSLFKRIFYGSISNVNMSGIGQMSITPVMGISVVAAILSGVIIQINLFPEIANLPGLLGNLGALALPLVFLSVVLTYYQKKQ